VTGFMPIPTRRLLVAVLAASVAATPVSAQQPTDWAALADESVRILADYLKINTANPPGNELAGALFLKDILEREGIEAAILDTAELKPSGRANLYARLRGNGSKRAIALVHHIDVVPADRRYWTQDPFSGAVKDGYLYGRGALDMKGEGIVHLMAMIALKRSGVPLTRDIVYIANTDEELGSTGAIVFVERHPELLRDVEFLITEGGDNLVENGGWCTTGSGWRRSAHSGSALRLRVSRRTGRARRSTTRCRGSWRRSTGWRGIRRRCT
jgi:acetylornithine deacetylase/succinyl-diaminopimelate desuccinylase-like protein